MQQNMAQFRLLSALLLGFLVLAANSAAVQEYKPEANFDHESEDGGYEYDPEVLSSERQKRQIAESLNAAMDRSLTINPVGQPEYHLSKMDGGGRSLNNVGGLFGGSAGTKVWEKNDHSIGVGLGGSTVAGMDKGRPFHLQPEYGVGIGYQKGPYSVSVGAGRSYQNPIRPSNNYGVRFGYRFRRAALDDNEDQADDSPQELNAEPEHKVRAKRQVQPIFTPVTQLAMDKSVNPSLHGDLVDRYFDNPKNFGARAIVGVGTTIRDIGRDRIGLGLSGQSHIGVYNGRPYVTPPRAGVGLSYQRGPVTATLGMDRGQNHFGRRTTNWGLNFSINPSHRG